MKQFILQSVHAEVVAEHMNKMYGDYGKFTATGGNVNFESNINKPCRGELWSEISICAHGYHAASDDIAALRAERDELRTNIEAVLYALETNRGDLSINQRQALDNLRAILAKYEVTK